MNRKETDRMWILAIVGLVWLVSGILLLGPVLLIPGGEGRLNQGVVPFLMSPLLVVIGVPLLASRENFWTYKAIVPALSLPVLMILHFLLSYLLFHSPLPEACFRGGLFLISFSVFLMGLVWGCRGLGGNRFVSQWFSTFIGLLLTGSFVYASPFVDFYSGNASARQFLITLSTAANPILALGGGILKQDLLRGSFLYEHVSIGRFYQYSSPDWKGLAVVFLLVGTFMGCLGVYLIRNRANNVSSSHG